MEPGPTPGSVFLHPSDGSPYTPQPPRPPAATFSFSSWHKPEKKTKSCEKSNIIFSHITGILKAIVKYQKSNICVFDI